MRRCLFAALVALSLLFPSDVGSSVDVVLHRIDAEGIGETIGTVTASDTDQGLVITPNLQGLSAGNTASICTATAVVIPVVMPTASALLV